MRKDKFRKEEAVLLFEKEEGENTEEKGGPGHAAGLSTLCAYEQMPPGPSCPVLTLPHARMHALAPKLLMLRVAWKLVLAMICKKENKRRWARGW